MTSRRTRIVTIVSEMERWDLGELRTWSGNPTLQNIIRLEDTPVAARCRLIWSDGSVSDVYSVAQIHYELKEREEPGEDAVLGLLAAFKEIDYEAGVGIGTLPDWFEPYLDATRAAIAKAKGEPA